MGIDPETIKAVLAVLGLLLSWLASSFMKEKLKYPEKTNLICFINVVLGPLRALNLWIYRDGTPTMEKAMKRAMESTKLTDFDDTTFVENYAFVTNTEFFKRLKLTNLGYMVAQKELQINLKKRLFFTDYCKKNPQFLDTPLAPPVFVFGLGRSGTTFVHRLMALDPNFRAPRLWELLTPVPRIPATSTVAEFEADRQARLQFVREKIKERNVLGVSAMEQFHEIGAELPEECMMGLSADLPTCFQYLYTCLCQPQIFMEDLKGERAVKAYKRYRKVLQLLKFQTRISASDDGSGRNRTWLLKFPVHIGFIRELSVAFPNAKMIWAHRHPLPTVASLSAMMCALHSIYYDKDTCDPKEVGRNMSELCSRGLTKAIQDLKDTGLKTSHVIFNDLVDDPVATIKSVYKDLGLGYTQEFEANMRDYMVVNNAERAALKAKVEATGKIFDYQDPADYGLTLEGLNAMPGFKQYMDTFHFPSVR